MPLEMHVLSGLVVREESVRKPPVFRTPLLSAILLFRNPKNSTSGYPLQRGSAGRAPPADTGGVAADRVVAVRSPVDEESGILSAVHLRANLPAHVRSLFRRRAAPDVPPLRQRHDFAPICVTNGAPEIEIGIAA
jgi:hypothetical protein